MYVNKELLIVENKIVEDNIEKYKLPKEEHKVVLELFKEKLFTDKTQYQNPSIMFVVGQPGCGKTTYIGSENLSNYIIINSDNYRQFHKYSKEILDKYPTYYATLTNFDAHLWGDELFSYAIRNGYSVLREKAPIDYSLIDLISTIPNNYDIVINVVVRGNLASLLATRERYEKEILSNKTAKLSNIETHNKCYELLPDFILKCLSFGVKINYIVPVDREFKTIYVTTDNYLSLLQDLREESNEKTCFNYDIRINNIKNDMINRNAPKEQFIELEKIENEFANYMMNNDINKEKSLY